MSGYIFALYSIKSEGSSSKPESQGVIKNEKPLTKSKHFSTCFEVKEWFFDDEHKENRVIHPTLAKMSQDRNLCGLFFGI